jgi:hypothetical protein
MGYTTEFKGSFGVEPALDEKTQKLIRGLNTTRRMKRDVSKIGLVEKDYGTDGEFYITEKDEDPSVLEYNKPPATQPSLWMGWKYDAKAKVIEWDGGEKFYNYVLWIEYLIRRVFVPRQIVVNGAVTYRGEGRRDTGTITVTNNVVTVTGPAAAGNSYTY